MAKDDYFVLAYRILKYLYARFKAGERANVEMFGAEALGINGGYWFNLIESLYREGYITGVSFPPVMGNQCSVKIYNVKITQKGIEFLQENSSMKKAEAFLKTAKDIIPCI